MTARINDPPARLYELHANAHTFKSQNPGDFHLTNCDKCDEQYGARWTRICPVALASVVPEPRSIGQVCYEAFQDSAGSFNYRPRVQLNEAERRAWNRAAQVIWDMAR